MATKPISSDDLDKRLFEHIFSGDLRPGSRLVERDLAKVLGISRIPVREALSRLTARGVLIKDEKNRSVRIRQYTVKEVQDLLEYREAIEVASMRVACEKRDPNCLMMLEVICDEMEQEISDQATRKWLQLDRRFHGMIVEASGNTRFIHDFVLLIDESYYVFHLHPTSKKIREAAQSNKSMRQHMQEVLKVHRDMVRAMRDQEAETAVALLRKHLRTVSDRLSRDILRAEFTMNKQADKAVTG